MKQSLPIAYTPDKYEMKDFKEMECKYVSENERKFFETMLRKIQTEYASMRDKIIDYDENPEGVYLYREIYDDFFVGNANGEVEVNGLFRLLNLDLSEFKLFPVPTTLLGWLRKNDYHCVHYDNWEG